MSLPGISNVPYIRKVFFFTHGVGLLAGLLFPVITSPILGDNVKVRDQAGTAVTDCCQRQAEG